jgi:hypothetical protein
VDIEWARSKLTKYLELAQACRDAVPAGDHWNERAGAINNQATEMLPTITRILEALGAPPTEPLLPPSYSSAPTERLVRQGLGILHDREEWAVRLAPDEPDAPTLAADAFHLWVWRAAAPFWETGQTAAAVEYGVKSLTAHVQKKSGSRFVDRELAADVFSAKPRKLNPRLWLPGERDGGTWRSRQDGLHYLAMGPTPASGTWSLMRSRPDGLTRRPWSTSRSFSTVARWAEEAELVSPAT